MSTVDGVEITGPTGERYDACGTDPHCSTGERIDS
jgi:hypothetical protein